MLELQYTFKSDFPARRSKIDLNQRDAKGMIWLVEMASVGCEQRGEIQWAEQLRADAAQLRRSAADRWPAN